MHGEICSSCEGCGGSVAELIEMSGQKLCNECCKKKLAEPPPEDENGQSQYRKIYLLMRQLRDAPKLQAAGLVMDVWAQVHVEGVEVNRGRKENFYRIKLKDGGEIILNELESLTCTKFRMDFQRIAGILLPGIPYTKWACMLTDWLMTRVQGEAVEEISEQQEVIDSTLEHITSARLIKGVGRSVFGTVYYHDDALLVPNDNIKAIATKINRNLPLRKVSNILADYLLGPTKTYRVDGAVTRMWRFNPVATGVDIKEAIELKEDLNDI